MKHFASLLMLIHVSCLIAIGQTIQKHGPSEVYYVEDIIEGKNGRLFLSATGGLYTSDDVGETWQPLQASLNTTYFHPYLAKNTKNSDLYAWDLEDGIFSTSDNGANWKRHFLTWSSGDQEVKALAIDGDTLFIGTNNGLYHVQGTDVVRTPTEIMALQNNQVTSLYVDGNTVVVGTKLGGVFVSDDLGKQWQNKSNGLPDGFEVRGFITAGSNWYVYSQVMGVFRSTDRGANWSPKNTGLAIPQIVKLFAAGDDLYAATYSYENVYRSDLENGSWTLIDAGIPNEAMPNTLYVKGDNIIVGAWHGVFKSDNGGILYERSQTGITDAFVFRSLEVATDGTIWASGSHTGFYSMAPGEENFTLLPGVFQSGNYGSSLLMGDVLPIVQDYQVSMYNVVTKTWVQVYHSINVPLPDKFLQTNEGIFLSSRLNGVFKYNDSDTWIPFNDGLVSLVVTDLIDVGDRMIAATDDGLYVRSAEGTQWERIAFSAQDQGVHRLFIQDNRYILTAKDGNVYLSNDAGENWEPVNDLKSTWVNAFEVSKDDVLYAAAFSALFVSTDGGAHWVKHQLPNVEINSMVISGEKIFLATLEHGIWSTSSKFETITGVEDELNPVFSLYPNPAGHTINVILDNASETGDLRLVNSHGQTVHREQIRGTTGISISSLPTGIYFLRYSNGKHTLTKKVLKE